MFRTAGNHLTFRFLLGASVCLSACGSNALQNHGTDAAIGTGGSAIGPGGASGYGGFLTSSGGGSYGGDGGSVGAAGGKAGATTLPSSGGVATTGGAVASGGRTGYAGSAGAVGGTGGAKRDAGVAGSSQPDGASDVADAPTPKADGGAMLDGGWGDVGAALADFCVGSQSKVFHLGQTYEAPATSKQTDLYLDCCSAYAARVHTTQAVGMDFEVVLRLQGTGEIAGLLPLPSSGRATATLRTKPESKDGGSTAEPTMVGSANIGGQPFGSDAWTLGACVSVDDPASPFSGTRVYVPAVPVAPSGWASRLRFLSLKDTSIQVSSVEYKDIQTLDLATDPMMDLMDIDFVDLESATCGAHGAPTCNWVGLNLPFLSGTTLASKIPGTAPSMPFVVEADGERIYLGVFQSINSAYAPRVARVGFEDIRDDGFPIYPPPSTSAFTDLRNDPRIVKVLTEAGKLIP